MKSSRKPDKHRSCCDGGKESKRCSRSCSSCGSDDCPIKIVLGPKIPKLKYVRGSASPTANNDEFLDSFSYVELEGPLKDSFDPKNGKFKAKEKGIYQFAYYLTWQNQAMDDKRNDGERLCQLLRTFAKPRIENSFIGQYHSVPSQSVGLKPFFTMMSVPAILEMEEGDTTQFAVYQNNTDQDGLIAFIEFHIIKSSQFRSCQTNQTELAELTQRIRPRGVNLNN